MPTQLVLPPDWTAFINFLMNPITMSIVLTLFISHIPPVKNPDVTNLVKFLLAVFICIVWAIFVTFVTNNAFPANAQGWYAAVYLGLTVAFGNQLVWLAAQAIPGFGGFLVALFGRSTTTQQSNVEIKTTTTSSSAPPPASLPANKTVSYLS